MDPTATKENIGLFVDAMLNTLKELGYEDDLSDVMASLTKIESKLEGHVEMRNFLVRQNDRALDERRMIDEFDTVRAFELRNNKLRHKEKQLRNKEKEVELQEERK